ncbi:uncharacterized protein LOC124355180 [Homalodisca vitripennis]|uniref:uncharacterized protein LOC124355180 n=1 Tax=Homalodisca vitripennis TaxID=197043 RepID=UPI001EEACADD|nr:uncharacterized protein LOC124355180 [Homalodisca vitripennis]
MVIHQQSWFCICVCIAATQAALTDVYSQLPGGVLPNPVKYFKPSPEDRVAMESQVQDNFVASGNSERAQQPRLGFPLYTGTSGSGYSTTSPGVYSPIKLDLGGVLLGTVLGLGVVLLVPKLLHIFSYSGSPYSHYGRNDDVTSGLTEMISRVDNALAEHNINSTVCLERVLCSFMQPSSGSSSSNIFSSATRNPLISFLLEGSRLEKAVKIGNSGHNCAEVFSQCPFDQDSVASAFKSITSSLQT